MGNPVIRFEIGCTNQNETRSFYQDCFDWSFESSPGIDEVKVADQNGIGGHITSLVTEIDHYVTFYIQVEDIQAKLDQIELAGGKTVVPKITLPDGRDFAWFSDIEGNTIGLITK